MIIDEKEFSRIHSIMPIVCVDLVILNQSRATPSFLLLKRKVEPLANQWCIPGGRIRRDETLEDAVRHIADEETGLRLYDPKPSTKFWEFFSGKDPFGHGRGTHTVSILFSCFTDMLEPVIDKNHSDWVWCSTDIKTIGVYVRDESLKKVLFECFGYM